MYETGKPNVTHSIQFGPFKSNKSRNPGESIYRLSQLVYAEDALLTACKLPLLGYLQFQTAADIASTSTSLNKI